MTLTVYSTSIPCSGTASRRCLQELYEAEMEASIDYPKNRKDDADGTNKRK